MITRFPPSPFLGTLAEHEAVNILPRAANATVDALQVICAWPLSGQYGPGSRLLYVLIPFFRSSSFINSYTKSSRSAILSSDTADDSPSDFGCSSNFGTLKTRIVFLRRSWVGAYYLLRYYAFVITSVFSPRVTWLKTACFAATMLFPAVAAFHGIVLASVHVNGKCLLPEIIIYYFVDYINPSRWCGYGHLRGLSDMRHRHHCRPSHSRISSRILS